MDLVTNLSRIDNAGSRVLSQGRELFLKVTNYIAKLWVLCKVASSLARSRVLSQGHKNVMKMESNTRPRKAT